MRMRLSYLDCHEAELCCYLVIHIENIKSITVVLLPFVSYLLAFHPTNVSDEILHLCSSETFKPIHQSTQYHIPEGHNHNDRTAVTSAVQ
jgi:hypothetical protein